MTEGARTWQRQIASSMWSCRHRLVPVRRAIRDVTSCLKEIAGNGSFFESRLFEPYVYFARCEILESSKLSSSP